MYIVEVKDLQVTKNEEGKFEIKGVGVLSNGLMSEFHFPEIKNLTLDKNNFSRDTFVLSGVFTHSEQHNYSYQSTIVE